MAQGEMFAGLSLVAGCRPVNKLHTSPRNYLWLAWSLAACAGESKAVETNQGPSVTESCGAIVADADCDTSQRPIVFVHGTFGSGDNIAHVAQLFGSNGYCQDRFVAIEYNSLGGSPVDALDVLIDEVLAKTGQTQVDLMGHSQGTSHCVTYLGSAARAGKVAHYVNLSGATAIPNDVSTLSISSKNDLGQTVRHAPNATDKVTFEDQDHFGLASSDEAFVAIYSYLIGHAPEQTEVLCGEEEITVEGIAETFGDNTPFNSGKLEVFDLSDTAPQKRDAPLMTLTSDAQGRVGPFKLKRLTPYEFRASDSAGQLVGHMYFAPFKRSNRLARFLSPSKSILVSSISTDRVTRGPAHSAVVVRNIRGAFRHDLGDSLQVDGKEVLADDTAGRTLTTVGLFLADQNSNGVSELGESFMAPFIVGTDVFMSTKKPDWIELRWNGTRLAIPNWPSDQGMISVLLP